MYLSGISVRKKIAGVTDVLSRVKVGKDALSRIASRLEEEQKKSWRERPLRKRRATLTSTSRPPTCEGALGGASLTSMALLACVGREDKGPAAAIVLRGCDPHLIERGTAGARFVRLRARGIQRRRAHDGPAPGMRA